MPYYMSDMTDIHISFILVSIKYEDVAKLDSVLPSDC